MQDIYKGLIFGTAVLVGVVTAVAVELWQWRQGPTAYDTHGRRRPRND